MNPLKNYYPEAEKLSKVIDIAIKGYERFKPFDLSDMQLKQSIDGYKGFKHMALNLSSNV